MLRKASTLRDYAIVASDGELGSVSDFLIDDATWRVRWLVVDTGHWLSGRRVLLPTFVLGHIDVAQEQFRVSLTKKQVEDSPDIDTHQPVSRRMEANVFDHYGWAPYWGGMNYLDYGGYQGGAIAQQPVVEPRWRSDDLLNRAEEPWDRHLRSVNAVTGYSIIAKDGEIGHIADFVIEDVDWSIRFLIVDTRNWWPGKHVLILPSSVEKIDWALHEASLNIHRQTVKDSPVYDPEALMDRSAERQFHRHYTETRP